MKRKGTMSPMQKEDSSIDNAPGDIIGNVAKKIGAKQGSMK
jgi:hypothetical protein